MLSAFIFTVNFIHDQQDKFRFPLQEIARYHHRHCCQVRQQIHDLQRVDKFRSYDVEILLSTSFAASYLVLFI